MMYVVQYGDSLYGPFHSYQAACIWCNVPGTRYIVREVRDPQPSHLSPGEEQERLIGNV